VATFVKGDIVVVPFPFSDLSKAKRRPAFIAAILNDDDLILCQITSRNVKDEYAIQLNPNDFENGELKNQSNVRPNRIFTADRHIILYKIGHLKIEKTREIIDAIIEIVRN